MSDYRGNDGLVGRVLLIDPPLPIHVRTCLSLLLINLQLTSDQIPLTDHSTWFTGSPGKETYQLKVGSHPNISRISHLKAYILNKDFLTLSA